jgi:hypothetical protein
MAVFVISQKVSEKLPEREFGAVAGEKTFLTLPVSEQLLKKE